MNDLIVGESIPNLTATNQKGDRVSLKELFTTDFVVIYFYPKDETMGCTAEACSFRDMYESFTDAGARVIGVSSDSEESHRSFAENHRLPFDLLSDPDKELQKAFGVKPGLFGMLPGRVTFVLNREGRVLHRFSSQLQPKKHVEEALEVIRAERK